MQRPTVTLDPKQKLYILKYAKHTNCLGYQVAYHEAYMLADWLKLTDKPDENHIGTLEGYADYCSIITKGKNHFIATGQKCPVLLIPELCGLEGRRIEVTDKYNEVRRFQVGKSTGWLPIHLELYNSRSTGGGAVTGYPFKSVRIIR